MSWKLVIFCAIFIVTRCVIAKIAEQYQVFAPAEFHDVALKKFLDMRKENPNEGMDYDGKFMTMARAEAVKRFSMRAPEELSLIAPSIADSGLQIEGSSTLQLPSPEAQGDVFTAAVNTQTTTSSGELILPAEASAMALQFSEDIGLGAISKAGGLPMGQAGEWIKFAENKIKKENDLDYQSLLWEYGSSVSERQAKEQGAFNVTREEELLAKMTEWFTKGGGKLKYVAPKFDQEFGFQLKALEDVSNGEVVVSVPMKLIMCQQTARNILIHGKGRYLGEELQKTFDKNEVWGLAIFLLHEYFKEMSGIGSKWGPFLRVLRMSTLTTDVLAELKGTMAAELWKDWSKSSDSFMWFSVGTEGPCSPASGICRTKPKENIGDSRFNIHHIRWAYWVVKQNAIRVRHATTGYTFLALIPFFGMMEKQLGKGGGVSFDFDGSISLRIGLPSEENQIVGLHPGNYSDSEFFLRYLSLPQEWNPHTILKLNLPGTIPKGSKFHYCIKGTAQQMNSDECKGSYRSDAMFWKSKVLGEWRKRMNLPPRLQDLRMWATRLHLYGGTEEVKLLSKANENILAGLPIPVDQMSAEEQLMLMGMAKSPEQASALIESGGKKKTTKNPTDSTSDDSLFEWEGGNRPPPQLYSAPDPEEDPEARRYMENLAMLAVQAQSTLLSGNLMLNATLVVLNHTRDFFLHGVLPRAGLDELDQFLLKKIGMLSHCGFEEDMFLSKDIGVTKELMCALRVHLMNESEVHIFCPADARVWEDNCLNVEFLNYTAISDRNEQSVIQALKQSVTSMLSAYPTSIEEDQAILRQYESQQQQQQQKQKRQSRSNTFSRSQVENDEDADVHLDREGDFWTGDPDIELDKENQESESQSDEDTNEIGSVRASAIRLRLREKLLFSDGLRWLLEYEQKVLNGSVIYQIETKMQERAEADARELELKKLHEEIARLAGERSLVAELEVDRGPDGGGKLNLTLEEGQGITEVVRAFCQQHRIPLQPHAQTLETALRKRVQNPQPLELLLGVVLPHGDREILGIAKHKNLTLETGVFCSKFKVSSRKRCEDIERRAYARLNPTNYQRRTILTVPVDAPDTRKLQLIIHEGEQHDLLQYVSDFFQFYKLPMESVNGMAQEVFKRLPAIAMTFPVGLAAGRGVNFRISTGENLTNVVEAFSDMYEVDESAKVAIFRRVRYGMAPGSFLV